MSYPVSLVADGFQVAPAIFEATIMDSVINALAVLVPHANALHRPSGIYGARNLLRECPAVAALASDPKLLAPVVAVLGPEAFPVRGLFFDKLPGANWEVGWHQDLSIAVAERLETPGFGAWSVKKGVVHVQPPASILENMLTVRVHLDDCGEDNGPLRVLRGSHGHGRLTDEQIEKWKRPGGEVTCIVPKGGVLLMRPLLLHASSPARNPRHRRVIHLEYASAGLPGGLRWFEQAG